MPRLLFEKTGNAVWISHLDLMRLFQRAFKRADLPLKHTQGYNPRPSVSIALPLSVGIESNCELLDFDLERGDLSCSEILERLAPALVKGVRVLEVYEGGRKLRDLAYLSCSVTLEYDDGVPSGCVDAIRNLFQSKELLVSKKSKNGPVEQDIIPMIQSVDIVAEGEHRVRIEATIRCQNPTMNPVQLADAVKRYLPQYTPSHYRCVRRELLDINQKTFR